MVAYFHAACLRMVADSFMQHMGTASVRHGILLWCMLVFCSQMHAVQNACISGQKHTSMLWLLLPLSIVWPVLVPYISQCTTACLHSMLAAWFLVFSLLLCSS